MSQIVEVGASKKQLSKLRNGHRVRIKPVMEGQGVCLIVNPEKYNQITRTFSRSKGLDISLSPEELLANQSASSEMEGKGIFGKKFDRGLKKVIGRPAQRALYAAARENLPLAQAGLTAGLTAGATALGAIQPELIPFLPFGVASLSAVGSDYLANPSKYQSNAGGSKAKLAKNLAGRVIQDQALQQINAQTGANLGALDRASIQSAITNKALAELNSAAAEQKRVADLEAYYANMMDGISGNGLYAGRGLGLGMKQRRCGGAIGINGTMLKAQHPALSSQPFGTNFQFQNTLPPAYQKFAKGSGLSL